jgi:hypothetical protein
VNDVAHAERKRDEDRYLSLLQSILKGGHLYYSTHYDLTHRAQKQHALREQHQDKPMWERVRPQLRDHPSGDEWAMRLTSLRYRRISASSGIGTSPRTLSPAKYDHPH